MTKSICFVASARDYHAIDWYRTVRSICLTRIIIATDLIESEGEPKLIDDDDEIYQLFNLDRWLLKRQVGKPMAIAKISCRTLSAHKLSAFAKKEHVIFHAHSMYYIFLCWLAESNLLPPRWAVMFWCDQSNHGFTSSSQLILLKQLTLQPLTQWRFKKKSVICVGRQSQLIQNGIDTEKLKFLGNKIG